ncbi:MAG: TonB-dependent receptor [Sphingomonadales bacterium]|nr:TonB-dependent receptor [Sphingomonadales bacterium]
MKAHVLVASMLAGTCVLLHAGAASAQITPGRQATDEVQVDPQDIVVTARKRAESILKVPIVMTALTDQQLQAYATHNLYTVAARVPGLLIGTSLAANGIQASIRGVGTVTNNATIDNSISLNVDGLQLSQGLAYGIGMFDVGQVEVLKGPQALFYGKNSPAGVISLRSADPTDKFELIARAGYEFEAKEKVGELIISGPVSDALKLRLATRYSDQEGFFRNDAQVIPGLGSIDPTDRRVTPTKDLILRGTALFAPGGGYTARLKTSYEYTNIQGTWPGNEIGYCPEGTGGVAPLNIAFIGGDDCKVNRSIRVAWPDPTVFTGLSNGGKPYNKQKQLLASFEQNIQLGNSLKLTTLTGYYWLDQRYLFLATVTGGAEGLVSDSGFKSHQFTQEVRLASDFGGPINFTLGSFYQKADQKAQILLRGNTVLRLPSVLTSVAHDINIESYSVFGQLVWKLAPDVELSPGGRWTHEARTHRQFNYNAANGPIGQSTLLDPQIASDNFSPEVTLTFTPNNDLTLFASYKTGFKSGSFNGVIFLSPTTPGSFGDEKVKGGEVGLKTRLLDRQLSINAAAYYYRYSNLQVGANEVTGTALILRTLNAAAANIYGVDFDASFAPSAVPGLRLSAAVNYNHARYASFPNAPCGNGQTIALGCNQLVNPANGRFTSQDLQGHVLVRAPEWMGSVGIDYDLPMANGMKLSWGGLASFSSKYSVNLIDQPGFYQSAYFKLGANVTLHGREDRWELALIGNNLNNRITSANCFNSNSQNGVFFGGQIAGAAAGGPAGLDEAACVAERGREVWIRATVKL